VSRGPRARPGFAPAARRPRPVADGHSIQLALSAADALAVAIQLIDAVRSIRTE